jgi:hypothetical protein
MGYLVGELLPHSVRVFHFGFRISKLGPILRPPVLPQCCKEYTLTPHPFIYGYLEAHMASTDLIAGASMSGYSGNRERH